MDNIRGALKYKYKFFIWSSFRQWIGKYTRDRTQGVWKCRGMEFTSWWQMQGIKKGSMKCCRHRSKEGHLINQYKGFCNKVMQMMIRELLLIERTTGQEMSMMEAPGKEMCHVQIQLTSFRSFVFNSIYFN